MARENTKGSSERSGGPAAKKRLALLAVGGLLTALLVGYLIAQGDGDSSEELAIPSGNVVAVVEGVPEGEVTKAELKRAVFQGLSEGVAEGTPGPGAEQFRRGALEQLLVALWVQGAAEELGITVSKEEVEDLFARYQETSLSGPGTYEEYLETSRLTEAEFKEQLKSQLLSTKLQEQVQEEAPPPSEEEIADYYEETKESQYTTRASRDVRVIYSKDKASMEAAKKALEADSSPANWMKVVNRYSDGIAAAKSLGGLRQEVLMEGTPGSIAPAEELTPIKKFVTGAATGELVGPLPANGYYMLVETVKLHPKEVQTLGEARSEILKNLENAKPDEYFQEFVDSYKRQWTSLTVCARGYVIEQCANYKKKDSKNS